MKQFIKLKINLQDFFDNRSYKTKVWLGNPLGWKKNYISNIKRMQVLQIKSFFLYIFPEFHILIITNLAVTRERFSEIL